MTNMNSKRRFGSIKMLEEKQTKFDSAQESKDKVSKRPEEIQKEIDEEVKRQVALELKKQKPVNKLIPLPYDYDRKLQDICDNLYDYRYRKNMSSLLLEYVKSAIDKDIKKIKN